MSGYNSKGYSKSGTTSGGEGLGQLSSFNELITTQLRSNAQGDFVYSINQKIFDQLNFSGGYSIHSGTLAHVSSSNSPSGSAILQLRRGLKYQPGQGSLFRGTAVFTTGTLGNRQLIGAGNLDCGYYFGYVNQDFGIIHQSDLGREVRVLNVSSGVGSENVTITLNGKSKTFLIDGGGDTSQTSYLISNQDFSQVGDGWTVDVIDSKVYFLSARPGSRGGTYSAVGSVTPSLGTFTQVSQGYEETLDFISQSQWNRDSMDGSGPSRMTLNPQFGNVYQIGFQYLGFGNAFFGIENEDTGRVVPVHVIENTNKRTSTVLKNPNVSGLISSTNFNTGVDVTIKAASLATFTEAAVVRLDPKYAHNLTLTVPNSSNIFRPFLALKANRIFNNKVCYGEIELLKMFVSNNAGSASPKSFTIGLFLDGPVTGDVDFQYINQTQSIASYATLNPGTGGNTFATTTPPLFSASVGSGGTLIIDLQAFEFGFQPGRIMYFGVSSGDANSGEFSINWYERQ